MKHPTGRTPHAWPKSAPPVDAPLTADEKAAWAALMAWVVA